MKHATTLSATMPALGGKLPLELASGICSRHGASSVLVRAGLAWHCSQCLEVKLAQEGREHWLQARIDSLHKIANFPARYIGKKFLTKTPEQRSNAAKSAWITIRANRAAAALEAAKAA